MDIICSNGCGGGGGCGDSDIDIGDDGQSGVGHIFCVLGTMTDILLGQKQFWQIDLFDVWKLFSEFDPRSSGSQTLERYASTHLNMFVVCFGGGGGGELVRRAAEI